nr:Rpn family recombination-promoting nuclease/putative transposase [Aquibacillus albus]
MQQELFQEIVKEKKGELVADQIVKVFLTSGEEKWILIHIEVQGDSEPDFPKRMFRYYYRIYDKFNRDVVAIALLTDNSHSNPPDTYHYSFHGTSLTYKYNMVPFYDHEEKELVQSNNPFAIAVLAAKYAKESKGDEEKRYRFKRQLFRMILQKNTYPPVERRIYIATLIYFIDYLLQIPLELTQKLRDEIIKTKEGKEMVYMDREHLPQSWAELEKVFREEGKEEGEKKGLEKGLEEGKKSVAIELLKAGMTVEVVANYAKLPLEKVKEMADELSD